MNVKKWHQSEICIVINDTSQGSIAKHLRCDELHYYTFIIQSAGERIFKIDEHLAKLQAKWLIVSCAPFALHFCPQRCWSRQINWITCVLWTETVTNCCYFNRQINVSLLSTVTNQLLIMYSILPGQLFFVVAVVYSGSWDFLYGQCKQLFDNELNDAYFSRQLF